MAKKSEIVSWDALRRDVAALDQICLALVPKRQKRQSAAVLRYLIRSWNTRTTRYNGAVPGEWISRSIDQMLKANLANSRNPLNEYLQRLGPPRESANCVRDECANLIVRKRMKYGAKSKVVVPHFQLSRELLDLLEAIDFARRKMPEKTFKAFRDLICEPINDATPKEAYDYGPTYHLARIAFKHRASHRYNFDDFKADIEALHTKANTFDPKASSNPVSGQSVGYPDSGHPLGYPVSGQPDLITGPSKEVGTEGLKTECGQAAPTSVSTEEIFQAVDVGKDTLSDNEKLKVQEAASQAKKEAAQDAKHAALMAKYKKSGAKA